MEVDGVDPFTEFAEWLKAVDTKLQDINQATKELQRTHQGLFRFNQKLEPLPSQHPEYGHSGELNELMMQRHACLKELRDKVKSISNLV